MSSFLSTIKELSDLAEKAKQPIPTFIAVAVVLAEREEIKHAENSASTEEKSKISSYLDTLNGHVTAELSPKEVIRAAGVRTNRGTAGFARSEIKRLLITYNRTT